MLEVGFEPTQDCSPRILSPIRMPIPTFEQLNFNFCVYYIIPIYECQYPFKNYFKSLFYYIGSKPRGVDNRVALWYNVAKAFCGKAYYEY